VSKIPHFLKKIYFWRKLEKFDIGEPIFVLTGDVDTTALSEEKMGLLRTNLEVANEYETPYWIFVTPDPVAGLRELCDKIRKWGKEVIIGCHGLKHISFSRLSYQEQFAQLVASKAIFWEVGTDVFAVRTPYLSLNKHTCRVVSDIGFRFDFSMGFGFPSTHSSFFLQPRKLKETIFIPLATSPDLYFNDRRRSSAEISSTWISESKCILEKHGVLTFLTHPAECPADSMALKSLLEYISQQNVNFLRKDTFG
jgi:peptidoglycan/xylan/chitin deacetylase (PgdA/CDA1 family)